MQWKQTFAVETERNFYASFLPVQPAEMLHEMLWVSWGIGDTHFSNRKGEMPILFLFYSISSLASPAQQAQSSL